MELLQLTYFCTAAECENISRAAEKYGVPPSGVSQSIRRLEVELGAELFLRTSNRITLSESGKIFYSTAKSVLLALEEGRARLLEESGKVAGEIRLLIETNRRIATLAIEDFKAEYPSVNFAIHHKDTEKTSRYDIIVSDSAVRAGFTSEQLMSERILLAVNKSSPLSRRGRIQLSSLRDERFVGMSRGSRMSELTYKLCREAGFTPNTVISTDDPHYVRKYVEMGLGVALVPEISWRGLFSENIALVNVGNYKRDVKLLLPSDGHMSRASKLFCGFLRKSFEKEEKLLT